MAKQLDLSKVLHSFIDSIVINPESLNIDIKEEEKEVFISISGESNDISRLIGKKGIVATSIREAMSIAGKESEKYIKIHFQDNFENENKVEENKDKE